MTGSYLFNYELYYNGLMTDLGLSVNLSQCTDVRFLFCDDKVIVLLAFLCQEIFAIEQIIFCEFSVESFQFFLVDAHTPTLREFAHFTL